MIIKTAYNMKPPVSARLIPGHPINRGLVGCWLFNDSPPLLGVTQDISGNGNHGTLVADTHGVAGKFGTALDFDGTGDYVDIADNDTLDFGTSTNFSISFWAKPISNLKNVFISKKSGGASPYHGYSIEQWTSSNSKLKIYITDSDTTTIVAYSAAMVPYGVWSHMVCVAERVANATVYVNGVAGTPVNMSGILDISNPQELRVGVLHPSYNYYLGQIDHVMIWNRALSATEIQQLYIRPFQGIERRGRAELMGYVAAGGDTIVRTINDPLGVSDTPTRICGIARTLNESLGMTSDTGRIAQTLRSLVDSLGITDQQGKGQGKSLADGLGMIDSLVKDEARAIAETLGITDSLSQIAVVLRAIDDSLAIADSVSDVWIIVRTIAESVGIADDMIQSLGDITRIINESLAITDSPVRTHVALRSIAENVGLADALARLIVVNRLVSDSIGVTDGLVLTRLMTVTDSLGISDAVNRLIHYVRTQDESVSIGDAMVRVAIALRTMNDTVSITDVASEQLEGLLKAVWAFMILRQVTN